MAEPIWVGVRLRPLVNHEIGQEKCLNIEGNEVSIVEDAIDTDRKVAVTSDFDRKSTFAFDVAMDSTDESSPSFISQEKCYEIMGRRMVGHMLQGFNTCLFCYGQTGTGKTTTIMGKAQPKSERGLLMRLVDDVFEEVDKEQSNSGSQVHVVMQMLEVYNEKLKDLLATSDFGPIGPGRSAPKKINIHVHPELGVYLTGAIEAPVKTAADCINAIEYGNAMKAVSATAMNAQSSRGHTVFKLNMVKEGGKDNLSTTSEVCFADLAGRENEKTTQVTGERFVELSFINKSLLYLSGCIQSLGQTAHRRRQTVAGADAMKPKGADMSRFRNSKLTLLLSNALSGNSRTSMIGTLSPAAAHFEESHNTLRFASTVKTIKVQAKAARAVDKDSLVKQLQKEVQQLKLQLEQAREKHDDEDISAISVQLEATTAIVAAQTRDWTHFQQESAELSKKRTKTMESLMAHSSSQVGDCPLPYLANYSEDPHLAFRLVMHVAADGEEHSLGSGPSCNFRLPPSLGVCDVTGYIRNEEGRLLLRPAPLPHSIRRDRPASIEVNGEKLSLEPAELNHLDCVLFGHSTTFYVFLQKVSPEELSEKLRAPYEIDKEEWEVGLTQKVVNSILGEAHGTAGARRPRNPTRTTDRACNARMSLQKLTTKLRCRVIGRLISLGVTTTADTAQIPCIAEVAGGRLASKVKHMKDRKKARLRIASFTAVPR
ncbi:Kif14 [Symbiodinium natans]|uniref:Kif14 protein n=1 Tax=Symbiodinium natans TaxID=878477 RepID=A0A812UM65_9DINO|nr:Kif14 [Symbiodinium natans]